VGLNNDMSAFKWTAIRLWQLLPTFSEYESLISWYLFRELVKGKPIPILKIAQDLDFSEKEISDLVSTLPEIEFNRLSEVVCYRGVTLKETKTYLVCGQSKIFAWSAFDALALSALMESACTIYSNCSICKNKLIVNTHDCERYGLSRVNTLMSFFLPSKKEIDSDLKNSFSNKVHLLCDTNCGQKWLQDNAECELLTMKDSLFIAKKRNDILLRT